MVKYIKECREMKLKVDSPDINVSLAGFTPQGDSIRFGLNAVKNLGEAAVETILAKRAAGPFTDLFDFCERAAGKGLNKRVIESLVKSGALDAFGPRASLFAAIERGMEQAQKAERERQSGQHGLFLSFDEPAPAARLPVVAEWTEEARLAGEKEVLGYFVSGHPLDRFLDRMVDLDAVPLDKLNDGGGRNQEITVAGILSGLQVKRNKKGESWAVASLEDRTGRRELLCFAEAYKRLENQLRLTVPVLVRARLLQDDEGEGEARAEVKLQAMDVQDLAAAPIAPPQGLRLKLALDRLAPDAIARLAQAIHSAPPGSAKIHLHAQSRESQFEQIFEVEMGVGGGAALRRELEGICGPGSVRVIGAE
jgi:DNA polymerase-3 subunit alpha